MNIHDFAQMFVQVGIAIIPLYHRSKMPMIPTWEPFTKRLPYDTEYLSWFAADWNNYGVVCGWSNLVVIDFDNIEYYNIWREWLLSTQYQCNGLQVRTRHGMHVYVRTVAPATNDKRISRSGGIDVQAQGKYVVGPGSVHPTGHVYEAMGDFTFPIVPDVETILPLDLFPRVRAEDVVFNGAPIPFECNTEYLSDPLTDTRDLISKVKGRVRIESLFPDAKRSSVDGKFLKALCLFHDDHHESFWINTVKQLCGCQVCNMKNMDVINLYSKMHNISNAAAVTALAEEVKIWK